ncbi:obscurin, partial [Caerostris extrusa]
RNARKKVVPACYLGKSTAFDTLSSYVVTEAELDPKELEALQNRENWWRRKEDFAKDMQYVVDNYYKQMDNPRLPKEFRDRKGSVFGNFKDISDFHNNVLMKGVNYHAKEPTKLGKTFLRLERDFDMHASYCWNEARAQRLLKEGPLKEFFDDHSRMIDDDKFLIDHLKLPIQRLNDYQLLLKELIKYSSRLNEDTADLQKALDFIHSINTRTKDLQYILAIEGCKGDLLKIGRILNHEIFDVYEGNEVSSSERYVFLFKGRVFVTEKRVTSDKESYHVTNLFRLQDVDLIDTVDGDALKILFKSHKKNRPGFPLSLRARSAEQKSSWLKELLNANQVVEDLGDLEPSLENSLVASNEQLVEKSNDLIEPAEDEKPKTALKRQDSVKKSKGEKTPDSSVPQTPTEADAPRPLKRQESVKKSKRSGDTSAPETPTETFEKPPKLLRQDSKKSKTSDSSAPETPTEVLDKRPKLSRQDSKKAKTSDSSAPETPVESSEKPPPLSRQDSKKSKASDVSAPETPVESTEKPPPLSRQDSKKSKASDVSAPETPVESTEKPPPLSRQDSKKSKASDASAPGTPVESSEKSPLSRQDSKKSKTSDVSAPETPVESSEKPPSLIRQDSKKSKSSDVSAPETPIESSEKPPSLSRQDSKKSKASDASAPGTPVETSEKPPPLSRQDSKKFQASAPETPTESKEPRLARQDSKKSKTSDTSEPATPTDTTTAAPALTRQDSVKKKQKKQSVTEKEEDKVVPISEEKEAPPLARQESVSKKSSDKRKAEEEESKSKLRRQESLSKKEEEDKKKSKQGEEPCGVPTIIMSEDASASEARMESMELGGEDSATLASESIRSDSVTPPGSGAYQKPSLPSSTFAYYHVLILIPVLCACYVFTQFWSTFT